MTAIGPVPGGGAILSQSTSCLHAAAKLVPYLSTEPFLYLLLRYGSCYSSGGTGLSIKGYSQIVATFSFGLQQAMSIFQPLFSQQVF